MRPREPISPALEELLRRNGEFDDQLEHGPSYPRPTQAGPPPQPVRIWAPPKPDWDAENRFYAQREKARKLAEAKKLAAEDAAKLEPAEPPAQPDPPAQKRRRWRSPA